MVTDLSTSEKKHLENLEDVINNHIDSFISCGKALSIIWKRKLYRKTHKTFDEYCSEKWQLSRSHVYRQIEAFKVSENVSHGGQNDHKPNERQARELAKVPVDKQQEVWDLAVAEAPEKNGKPKVTGVQVKKIVDKALTLKRGEYTDRVAQALASKSEFASKQQQISKLIQEIKALSQTPLGTFIKLQQLETDLRNAWQGLKFAAPFAPCGYCGQDGCKVCHNQGWVTRSIHKFTPSGLTK